jgi:thioredoxin 1
MKFLITLTILILIAFVAFNFPENKLRKNSNLNEGIRFFEGDYYQAIKLAKNENKIVFIDFYATWCGPCKRLKSNTFSDKSVGTFYNQNFVNLYIDAEKGEGVTLAEKYNVKAYPTLIFTNQDGVVVKRVEGYMNANAFLSMGVSLIKK